MEPIRISSELVLHLNQYFTVDEEAGSPCSIYLAKSILRISLNGFADLALVFGWINNLVKGWERYSNSPATKAETAHDRAELLMTRIDHALNDIGIEYHIAIQHEEPLRLGWVGQEGLTYIVPGSSNTGTGDS